MRWDQRIWFNNLQTMRELNSYHDFTIKCGEKTFPVHRHVVCRGSKVIAAAIEGPFKEAITKVLDLEDDDPEIVHRMINFLYAGHYNDYDTSRDSDSPIPKGGSFCPVVNAKVYIIGDKYLIPGLKYLARDKYRSMIRLGPQTTDWDSASLLESLKLLHEELPENDTRLASEAIQIIQENISDFPEEELAAFCKDTTGALVYQLLGPVLQDVRPRILARKAINWPRMFPYKRGRKGWKTWKVVT